MLSLQSDERRLLRGSGDAPGLRRHRWQYPAAAIFLSGFPKLADAHCRRECKKRTNHRG